MSTLNLEYPRSDAKKLVKLAFEHTDGIDTYHDNGLRIVGKTGFSLASYGENITVEVPENQASDDETMVSISAEKEVSMNVTANPQKYEDRFLMTLNSMRGESIDDLIDEYGGRVMEGQSKEVTSPDQQADGSSKLGMVMVIMFVLTFFFMMIPLMAL